MNNTGHSFPPGLSARKKNNIDDAGDKRRNTRKGKRY